MNPESGEGMFSGLRGRKFGRLQDQGTTVGWVGEDSVESLSGFSD